MQKVVNGEIVDMTPAEIAARQAEEAAWAARVIPTDSEIDQDELNRALAQEGSVARAGLELLFDVITGRIPVTPSLNKQQFVTLLRAKMRTRS